MKSIVNQIRQSLRAKAKPLSPDKLEWARKIVGKDFNPLGVKTTKAWEKIWLIHL